MTLHRLLFLSLLLAAPLSQALPSQAVHLSELPEYFDLSARLEAVSQSTVSAQTSGAVTAIYFDVNDQVSAGSVLLRIANTEQQASLQQAMAGLEQAKAQSLDADLLLKRNQLLFEQKSLSQGEYDSTLARAKSAQAAVKASQARLKQTQEQLKYTEVRAPYSGLVSARHVEVGELVNPGSPLMTGLALSPLRAVTSLPQALVKGFAADKVSLSVDGAALAIEKTTLYPYADSQYHSVQLRLLLRPTTQALYPGQWAKVRVQSGTRQSLVVPQSALLKRGELSSLYVLENGQPKLRQVRTGDSFNDQIEVLAGLKAGEVIVLDALAQLAQLTQLHELSQ